MKNEYELLENIEKDTYNNLKKMLKNHETDTQNVLDFDTDDSGFTNIRMYGMIENDRMFGIAPMDLVEAMKDAGNIRIFMDSPGGSVFAARNMANALRRHRTNGNRVETVIDGFCGSAATIIACASDEVIAGEGTRYMIHNAQTVAIGNKETFRELADNVLARFDNELADMYVEETGMDKDEVIALMTAETSMDVDEAIERGFVDRRSDDVTNAARQSLQQINATFSMEDFRPLFDKMTEMFENHGKEAMAENLEPSQPQSSQEDVSATQTLSKEEINALNAEVNKTILDMEVSKLPLVKS